MHFRFAPPRTKSKSVYFLLGDILEVQRKWSRGANRARDRRSGQFFEVLRCNGEIPRIFMHDSRSYFE